MATAQKEIFGPESIEPVTDPGVVGQLVLNWSGLIPPAPPRGFIEFLGADEGTRFHFSEVMANAFSDWAHENSGLERLSGCHLPSIAGGRTIDGWFEQHLHHCVDESARRVFESAEFLRLDRRFMEVGPKEAHLFMVKDEPVTLKRIVVCMGGVRRIPQVTLNALQVLAHAWHSGEMWWPRFERDRSTQYVLVAAMRRGHFAFMRMRWVERDVRTGVGRWNFAEEVFDEDHVFAPGEVLAFGGPLGSL
jgi:hypothetical protein